MSYTLMASVMDLDLPCNEKMVLSVLAAFADDAGGNCHPSMVLIAARAGMVRRSAQRMIRALEKRRLIDVSGRGRGTSYSYYLRHGSAEWSAVSISNAEAKERLELAESSGQSVPNNTTKVRDTMSPTDTKKPEKVRDNLSGVWDNLSSSSGQSVQKFGTGCHPNQSRTSQEPVSEPVNARAREAVSDDQRSDRKSRPGFEPPDWLPADAWDGFCEMRRRIKAPLTERAIAGIVGKLDRLRQNGHDPGRVLDQSTENAWRGVFPLRGERDNGGRHKKNGKCHNASSRRSGRPTVADVWNGALEDVRARTRLDDVAAAELDQIPF